MAFRRVSNQQSSSFHQIHLSHRAFYFLLILNLIAATSAALLSLPMVTFESPASPAVRSCPASHLRSATQAPNEPQMQPHGAPIEAQVELFDGNENGTGIDNPATRNPTLSSFHVFRAPFAVSLIEIPETHVPEIRNLDLGDASDCTDADAGESARLEDAIRADALYLEEAAVKSRKGMAPAKKRNHLLAETKSDEGKEVKKDGVEEEEAEEEEEEEEGDSGEVLVPLHVFRAADGSLQEEPETSDADLRVLGSLDALYFEDVAVRTRAAHAQPRAPLVGPRILFPGGASEKRDQEVGFFRSFHVFRAENGSLVELTEREAVLTSADGVLAPLTGVNGNSLAGFDGNSSAELVRVHQQELPVRFRPSTPSTSLTKIRRRLRLSNDKRIEIVYESAGSQRVEEETGEEDEEDEEQEHVGPVHVFWGEDGAVYEGEEDITTSRLTRYDGGSDYNVEVAGLGNADRRGAAVDEAVDAAAEAELEYELAFAVRTRKAMAIGGGEG
ncbi:unnamed protein product [Closterium sp. Yama58-4]|nr:unnamed protein product [Closterium sp. Yama58-4]